MNAIEWGVPNFMLPEKRGRYRDLLARPNGRQKLLARLDHAEDLDPACMLDVSGNRQIRESILETLQGLGAGPTCYCFSTDSDIDDRVLPLAEAIDCSVGANMGTLLVCVPSRLAYFEGEDMRFRKILRIPE